MCHNYLTSLQEYILLDKSMPIDYATSSNPFQDATLYYMHAFFVLGISFVFLIAFWIGVNMVIIRNKNDKSI